MPECPICRREYDDRFSVFVPPHPEGFDSIECAQRAVAIWGAAELAPVVLPTIEIVPSQPTDAPPPAAGGPKRGLAALAALALVPGQAALAGGVGLAAAGTAASIYLAVKPSVHAPQAAAPEARVVRPPAPAGGGSPAAGPSAPTGSSKATESFRSGPSRGVVDRPAKASRRSVVSTRPSRQVHKVVGAKLYGAQSLHGSELRSSDSKARASGSAQLISRRVPVTHVVQPSTRTPRPTAQPKPDPAPTVAHPPQKPQPKQPPVKPAPTQPSQPEGEAKPVSGSRVLASTDSSSPPHKKKKKQQTQSPSPPAPQSPPAGHPGPTSEDDCDTRPGNGNGDGNHEHTGPPGHDQQHGSDHGNGDKEKEKDKDHGKGQ